MKGEAMEAINEKIVVSETEVIVSESVCMYANK
jgi:hypothetical protein